MRWKGGGHTPLVVPRNRIGEHRWTTDAQTGAPVRALAGMLPDELIAGLLNRPGKKTGKGNSWIRRVTVIEFPDYGSCYIELMFPGDWNYQLRP